MMPTKLKKIKFKHLKLSAKFQYNEGDDEVWLKIGSNLITKWKKDEGVYWLEQTSRWVYEIVEEDVFATKGLLDDIIKSITK
jgi:hypothetical protein